MRSIISAVLVLVCTQLLAQKPYCSKYKMVTEANRLSIDDHRSDSLDILHTFITLDMTNVSFQQISGNAVLTVKSKLSGLTSIEFDLEGLTVDSVTGADVSSFNQLDEDLRVYFASPLSLNQESDITIYYSGSPMKDASGWGGFYFSGNFSWNLGVGFADEPHSYGRVWFPCFDNFIEKSTFEFLITTNEDRTAVCNGLSQGITNNGNGTLTHHWLLGQPISSYLACVAVAPYKVVEGMISAENGPLPYQIFGRLTDSANIAGSFQHLSDAVLKFEAAYGEYRFDKVGYSLVPFNSGAMEHATNITYPIYAVNGGVSQEELMAHELAHMWWGDNVTCETDGDMWINEGWASFSEYLFLEDVYTRKRYEDAMKADLHEMLQYAHHTEEMYRAVSGQPHEYVYGDHVYKKGALVAHNLRGYMGDEAFFESIHQFMEQFKYSSVSSDSLEKWFQIYSGQDLSSFFRDWVFTPGYSVVVIDSYDVEPNTAGYEIQLHLQQKLKGRADYHDDVPVYYSIYDSDWNVISGLEEMSGKNQTITVQSSIDPAYIALYERNELAQARTVDRMVVNTEGNLNVDNMMWDVKVESVQDSALIWFEHIWSAPDNQKDFDTKPYRLSNYHYWRVSGIDAEKLSMSGDFFYDGREGGNTGYMDMDLVSVQEDSLVLLYRKNAKDDWIEYPHYEKNLAGASDNGFGLMVMDSIWMGEYALANMDHSILSQGEAITKPKALVYPNPATDVVTIDISNLGFRNEIVFKLTDVEGKLVMNNALTASISRIETRKLAAGIYTYQITDSANLIDSGKVIIKR